MPRAKGFRYTPGTATVKGIDRRTRVGSKAWFARHNRPHQWLSSWRRAHMFAGRGGDGHKPVRRFARARGIDPSSRTTIKHNLTKIAQAKGIPTNTNMTKQTIGQRVASKGG